MRTFALAVGYIFLLGGLWAALYTWATHWAREEDDPIVMYRHEIMFFGVLAVVVGSAILILNGENVPIIFGNRHSAHP